jgi:hypothetical protein
LKDAIITGYDQRLWPCCGGLMIQFSDGENPPGSDFNLIDNEPGSYGLDASSIFPIDVKVKYKLLDKYGKQLSKSKNFKKIAG